MRCMFYSASSFNQDLCPWGNITTFPFRKVNYMFIGSGCTYQDSPSMIENGPFYASVSQLYSNMSLNESIANDTLLSVQATTPAFWQKLQHHHLQMMVSHQCEHVGVLVTTTVPRFLSQRKAVNAVVKRKNIL